MSQRKVETEVTRKWTQTIRRCDLCGLETKPGHDWPGEGGFERPDTEVVCKVGAVYPEGDMRTYHRLDVCPKCFVERFVPAVEEALGVRFETGDVDD